ncbi:UNVERIFIED_CONTAM: hypothetical protein K2H54_012552 [Gekko kuhli]
MSKGTCGGGTGRARELKTRQRTTYNWGSVGLKQTEGWPRNKLGDPHLPDNGNQGGLWNKNEQFWQQAAPPTQTGVLDARCPEIWIPRTKPRRGGGQPLLRLLEHNPLPSLPSRSSPKEKSREKFDKDKWDLFIKKKQPFIYSILSVEITRVKERGGTGAGRGSAGGEGSKQNQKGGRGREWERYKQNSGRGLPQKFVIL